MDTNVRIGILAVQGDVIEHARVLERLGVTPVLVRRPEDVHDIHGIIMPGGESTTMSLLLQRWGTFDVLQQRIADGMPAWGTCAGAILLAKEVRGKNPPRTFALMDIAADRNAYGTHRDSFTANIKLRLPNTSAVTSIEAVFIRAPKLTPMQNNKRNIHEPAVHRGNVQAHTVRNNIVQISPTHNSTVHVLATYNGNPVLLQQGRLLASAFHPELTASTVIHQYFLDQCTRI